VLQGVKPVNDTTEVFASFLQHQQNKRHFNIYSKDEDIVAAFAQRASFLAFKVLKRHDEEKASWNSLLVDFQRLSAAHSQYLVVKYFYSGLLKPALASEVNSLTMELLLKLYRLFALHMLENSGTEFQECEALRLDQLQHIRENSIMDLLEDIRPHAVCLVDAWNFPDWQLDSSLGRKDGMVYEDLFYRASQLNPLNDLTVDPNPDSEVLIRRENRKKVESKL
jgi:acyl-CoA oxidase